MPPAPYPPHAFLIASVLTSLAFVGIGWMKAAVTQTSRARAVLETLVLGGTAATLAYWVGGCPGEGHPMMLQLTFTALLIAHSLLLKTEEINYLNVAGSTGSLTSSSTSKSSLRLRW